MKLELFIFFITVFVLANTYFEGKLINKLKQYEKYYKMALFAFIGLCVYLFIKKNPGNYKEFVSHANSYIKYLPIDRNTASFISPIIDFTSIPSTYKDLKIILSARTNGGGARDDIYFRIPTDILSKELGWTKEDIAKIDSNLEP